MWFITVVLNGLVLATPEPFWSEEACVLAAHVAGIPQGGYSCEYVTPPWLPDEPTK